MTPHASHAMSARAHELYDSMDKLWEDHVAWTRLFIVSAVAGLPDKDDTTARLMQNQVDIGNSIRPYYGDAAGDQLTTLLKEHIGIAAELVAASKGRDSTTAADAKTRWFANADQIAIFLGKANPSWSETDVRKMMYDHLNLTLDEATARIGGDYRADIVAYDRIHSQILSMADMLASGIVSQFPEKFSMTNSDAQSLAEDYQPERMRTYGDNREDSVWYETYVKYRATHRDPFDEDWWRWHRMRKQAPNDK